MPFVATDVPPPLHAEVIETQFLVAQGAFGGTLNFTNWTADAGVSSVLRRVTAYAQTGRTVATSSGIITQLSNVTIHPAVVEDLMVYLTSPDAVDLAAFFRAPAPSPDVEPDLPDAYYRVVADALPCVPASPDIEAVFRFHERAGFDRPYGLALFGWHWNNIRDMGRSSLLATAINRYAVTLAFSPSMGVFEYILFDFNPASS